MYNISSLRVNKHLHLDNHYTTRNSSSLANDVVKLIINDKQAYNARHKGPVRQYPLKRNR